MKIFISHSSQDQECVDLIKMALEQAGHDIWYDSCQLKAGDNVLKKISEEIKSAEAIIVVLSKESLKSKWAQKEIVMMTFGEVSTGGRRIIPVLIDNSTLPSYLSGYMYIDLSVDFNSGLNQLVCSIANIQNKEISSIKHTVQKKMKSYERDFRFLSTSLKNGRLTLVCGAGTSIQAGIPSWNDLLLGLLESMLKKTFDNHNLLFGSGCANEFSTRNRYSALIIGKFLKNNLGDDFIPELRHALYSATSKSSKMIEAITNLSRPQRDTKTLDSIITFNFDSVIEESLCINNIKFKAIFDEGMNFNPEELPIFHVHGYLPREGDNFKDSNIVFSEDAYHSQFIDSFSWSNLIQLNKLSQNTCLFIGLSLTDPNLRRLLDVAKRKNPEKFQNHYIIKKKPCKVTVDDRVGELTIFLEEQDANELGLNVIWVESFDEIPDILNNIYSSENSN